MIFHVENETQFNDLIKKDNVLVDFFATWCGPCRMLGEVIEELDQNNQNNVIIVKVDVDKLSSIAAKYQVQAVPTLILFKNGEIKKTQLGYIDLKKLIEFVTK